jgi:hypothetical protein
MGKEAAPAPAKAKDAPTDKKADPKEIRKRTSRRMIRKTVPRTIQKRKVWCVLYIEFMCKGKLAEARNVLITAIFIVFWVFLLAHSLF